MTPRSESAEQAEFRRYCRAWLAEHVPPSPSFRLPQGPLEIATQEQLSFLCRWQRAAYDAGLVGCDYPVAFGGGGKQGCQRVANEEMVAAGAWFLPNVVGLGMAGPTILTHGTDAQREALLPGILSGSDIWCQGFSEPNAGSDLANVRTTAVRQGEHWLVHGSKIWTTLAAYAGWVILVCRTDPTSKYGGLTYFAAPLDQPEALEVRPLVKMTGEYGFFELHLDGLRIDDRWRLGEVGAGWQVAMSTLLHERGAGGWVTPRSGGGQTAVGSRAEELVELASTTQRYGRRASEEPVLRDRIVDLLISQRALDGVHRRAGVPALTDHPLRLALQHKVVESELRQAIARLGCEVLGAAASLGVGEATAPAKGEWPVAHMGSYGYTIAAGTNEIQRNILGERVLGLEKSK